MWNKRAHGQTAWTFLRCVNRQKSPKDTPDDPAGYVMRHCWTAIGLCDTDELEQLHALFNSLEAEIIAVIEATDALKESPDYALYHITEQEPEVFERVVEQQIAGIDDELTQLKTEAERLKKEIVELSGGDAAEEVTIGER